MPNMFRKTLLYLLHIETFVFIKIMVTKCRDFHCIWQLCVPLCMVFGDLVQIVFMESFSVFNATSSFLISAFA